MHDALIAVGALLIGLAAGVALTLPPTADAPAQPRRSARPPAASPTTSRCAVPASRTSFGRSVLCLNRRVAHAMSRWRAIVMG